MAKLLFSWLCIINSVRCKKCKNKTPPFKKSGISILQFSSYGLDLILKADMLCADAQNEKAVICHFQLDNWSLSTFFWFA